MSTLKNNITLDDNDNLQINMSKDKKSIKLIECNDGYKIALVCNNNICQIELSINELELLNSNVNLILNRRNSNGFYNCK